MAKYKWLNDNMFDSGLNYIETTLIGGGKTIKEHVIKDYASGDSYATVTGNSCIAYAITAGDLAVAAHTTGRKLTVSAKSGSNATANSGAGPNLHIALVNETDNTVLAVTSESTDQVITSGNPVTIPGWSINFPQPTT